MKPSIPSSLILVLCFLSSIGLLLFPHPANAVSVDARQWEMTADKLTRHENPPTIIAEGNVVLEKKEPVASAPPPKPSQWSGLLEDEPTKKTDGGSAAKPATELKTVTTVKADWVSYDITRGLLTAKGHLLIDIGTDQLTADSGSIDLEKSTGSFENSTVIRQQKDMHFEGKVIEKTGDLTYHIQDGWVVTCKLQPGETAPWSFAASEVEITDGGYAYLEHATFRIKDVPVLYIPVMLLPAKRQRQTGFLFPSFSFSDRDGFSLETPFFLNLSPSTDLTLYPRYYANRGTMAGAEYRYVFDEESKGMLMGNYLDDKLSDPSEVDYYQDGQFTHTNSERYWIRGKADQNFGDWTTRMDLDVASDLDYLREFNTGSTGFNASQDKFAEVFGRGFIDKTNKYRENSLVTLRSWQNGTALLGEALAVNDITEQIYTANNPSRAWTLPSLTYSGLVPIAAISGPDFAWDANYTNFWRDKGVNAQRIDLMPTVTAGIPVSPYVEANITGGIRNTAYMIDDNGASDWEDNDSENRFLSLLNGEIGTTLMRDFAFSMGEVNALSHTLRPFVSYVHTSIPDQKLLPQFDIVDELEEENTVYYGINNFFSIFGEHKGREFEREYAFLKAKQGYDLRSEESDTPLTPVIVETGFYPLQQMRLKYTTNIDIYGDGAFLHSLDGDYYSDKGDRFSLDYRYNELTDVNSVRGTFWYLLPYNFAAGYSLERAIEQSETIEEIARLRFNQPCWSVELSSNSTPGDQTFMITFRLANIGNPLGFDLPGK
ncbi:LPS assembly protein LptD [uncultured Desulfobulbus sp.]|uniref:LPS-assembly protein LptD n=1 Tax=uncultured Desulfobulbus sp. TaxID=239745 RepID=UPI0029C6FA34|nr:LPS assembly protein LptD [uncultured Desulfobulbus sp.]